jgi:hypothetical protein
MLNVFRYNPAMLATAAHQVVLKSSDIFHKVKATIQQAKINRLSTELLRGDTINKICDFVVNSAGLRGLEPLIKISLTYIKWKYLIFINLIKNDKHFYLCVHHHDILLLFQLVPLPISIGLRPNFSMTPKTRKGFPCHGENPPIPSKKLPRNPVMSKICSYTTLSKRTDN